MHEREQRDAAEHCGDGEQGGASARQSVGRPHGYRSISSITTVAIVSPCFVSSATCIPASTVPNRLYCLGNWPTRSFTQMKNCEPALCTVLFMAGAGGSLRAGVTENPVRLTRSVRDTLTRVTLGGVPAYVWPGGGITLMVDVSRMPEKSFGYVPTPALVAPIEFTLRADDYAALGGYASRAVSLQDVLRSNKVRLDR